MWLMRCWAFSSLCFEALEYRWVCLSLNRSYRLSSICLPGNHTLVHAFQISRSGRAQLWSVGLFAPLLHLPQCWFHAGPRETFLGYCVISFVCREQLAESILHEGSTGCRVVEKFLKILQVVVQEPGQVFKPFLPSIISLSMEQVYPIIAEVCTARLVPSNWGGNETVKKMNCVLKLIIW